MSPRILAFTAAALSLHAGEMFSFVMPWDDATPTITDLSAWNEKPAGLHGFIVAKDGHLFAGEKRIRIFGVNFCFGANFPGKDAAPKIAARLAKLGVNCVRFHHMDSQSAPAGLFAKDGVSLDPERLDRLDFFIAQLKANGIYADLNLHVSRTHPDRPKSEKEGNANYDKGVDNFSARMIALQKDYARALLSHVNPYTGSAYAQEPAVAFVEINNENALLHEWHSGGLDAIAAPYRDELSELWTHFLASRGTEAELRARFAEGAREAGPELLGRGSTHTHSGWAIEQHEGAQCSVSVTDDVMTLSVSGEAKEPWHAQMTRGHLHVDEGENYTLRFRGKSGGSEKIRVVLSQAHAPWEAFDSREVTLGPEWRDFSVDLRATSSDSDARVVVSNLARATPTTFAFTSFSLKRAAVDASLARDAAGKFPAFTRDDFTRHTPNAQEEWMRFLWSTEEHYWPALCAFLRDELGVRSLIVGTQLGWSPFPIQQKMDVIDSHAYWQHPHFPGRPWDSENWTVKNTPMAGSPNGGTLPPLALQRVAGKPYICTEYNHAAPNSYDAETFPLLCAYAALQDWDGVFAFAYSHRTDDWDTRRFGSFFDIDQHPTKLATLPGALALFRRGDVSAAREANIVGVHINDAILQTARTGPRLGAELFGVKWPEALMHRVGVRLSDGENFAARPLPTGPRYTSDTGDLVWDTDRRVVLVNTSRSKAVIGNGRGAAFPLGDVTIKIESAWACVQATVIEGESFTAAKRILITATASAENTGMKWRDAAKTSVGRDWGKAPSVVEGVAASITLPFAKKAWTLDARGQRVSEVPVRDGVVALRPDAHALWFEVASE